MATEQDPLLSAENGGTYSAPETAPPRKTLENDLVDKMDGAKFDGSNLTRGTRHKQVSYDSSSHISVLFQMYGSVWPKVLPYCFLNVLLTYGISIAKLSYGIDITIAGDGLSFMGILVAFLLVTRAKIAYARFMEARGYLQIVYKVCREIVQNMCIMTMHDVSQGAKQWRQDVAFQTIALLRVTMAAISFNNSEESPWDFAADSKENVALATSGESIRTRVMKWAHSSHSMSDENFRAPLVLAYALRTEILSQRNGNRIKTRRADTKTPMHPNEERYLLNSVQEFINGFHGLRKLITTPFPFPLVQMARTFLFVYTFALPFTLVGSMSEPIGPMLVIFFITYGFLGLEYVALELDDPFGDDPNDFDHVGMAEMAFEDAYIIIYKNDGPTSAEMLRKRVAESLENQGSLNKLRSNLAHDTEDVLSSITEDADFELTSPS